MEEIIEECDCREDKKGNTPHKIADPQRQLAASGSVSGSIPQIAAGNCRRFKSDQKTAAALNLRKEAKRGDLYKGSAATLIHRRLPCRNGESGISVAFAAK